MGGGAINKYVDPNLTKSLSGLPWKEQAKEISDNPFKYMSVSHLLNISKEIEDPNELSQINNWILQLQNQQSAPPPVSTIQPTQTPSMTIPTFSEIVKPNVNEVYQTLPDIQNLNPLPQPVNINTQNQILPTYPSTNLLSQTPWSTTIDYPKIDYNALIGSVPGLQSAFGSLLSGQPDTTYLNQQSQAIADLLTRNMLETVFPAIRSDALKAGQYGSSRQGIVETQAISRLNQELAPTIAGMYAQALENAKQRQLMASQLAQHGAMQAALGNQQAALDAFKLAKSLEAQTYGDYLRYALGLGQLGLESEKFNLQSALLAPTMLSGAMQSQYDWYNQLLNALNLGQQASTNLLGQYANLVLPIAGQGQTTVSQQPYYTNPIGGMMGGAAFGASVLPLIFEGLSKGAGAGIGAALGLLGTASDRKLKRNIIKLEDGLYSFKYHDSDRWQFGEMADEVEPERVYEYKGIKYIVKGR